MNIPLPQTIENITGEKLTFLRIVMKDGVEYLETESVVQPNAGPPMHVHYRQDESLTVLSGKIGYQELKGEKKYAGPGETVLFKFGVPHKFWNAGNEPLRLSGVYDTDYLLDRYKTEFRMFEIPTFVQKLIFPVSLFLGSMRGKKKKFIDAPDPL